MVLPAKVTAHTLRRTFASLCFFAGRDLRWTMGQLGHADPRMTLSVYTQVLARKRVDQELVWTLVGFADEPEAWAGGPRSGPMGAPGLPAHIAGGAR